MSFVNNITEEQFVDFLHGLGVETYNASFAWMLNGECGDALRWMYFNVDHNNVLTAREECRYKELEEEGLLLSPEDLESSISSIQEQYEGICLPGDKEAKEDVELDIKMLEERLHMLEKQKTVLADLKKQNKLANEELSLGISKLNLEHHQCKEDESAAAEECLTLAQEVETITNKVMDVIAEKLDVYSSYHCDKENAKKFFTFGPFETYRQSQALFRSYFDLYISKKFDNRLNKTSEEELVAALVEAKSMEERLSNAIWSYMESKADLCGEQAKVALVAKYKDVHPRQVTSCIMEAYCSVELLEQEESILYQQLHHAVREFVDSRTALVVETSASCALAVQQQIHDDLSHLLDTTQHAFCLDRVVYSSLRHELYSVEEFLQLAAQLAQYVAEDSDAIATRIDSMNELCSVQNSSELKLRSNTLIPALLQVLGAQSSTDPHILSNINQELQAYMKRLKSAIRCYNMNENVIVEFDKSSQHLRSLVWAGSARAPHRWDGTVSALAYQLAQQLDAVGVRIVEAGSVFTTVTISDNCRKMWQLFITDPARFQELKKMKNKK